LTLVNTLHHNSSTTQLGDFFILQLGGDVPKSWNIQVPKIQAT